MKRRIERQLEQVLQELLESEINAGAQAFVDAGMAAWIGDSNNTVRASKRFLPRKGARTAAAGDTVARWLHAKALELYPESAYARRYRLH